MTEPIARKGQRLVGPGGQGYTLTRDVYSGEITQAEDFEPFGGAPVPEKGAAMPLWLSVITQPGGLETILER